VIVEEAALGDAGGLPALQELSYITEAEIYDELFHPSPGRKP
jgi:hypothetical protein